MSEVNSIIVTKPTTVEVRLPSRMGFEKVAMSTAAAVAKLMGFREDRIEDLKTAVAEACINAIEHGNRLNEKLSVGVVLSADADSLEVKVIDDGKGMNRKPGLSASPTSTARCTARKDPRGMGMFLIQALVDEAEWVAGTDGNSSYVRLVIRLDKDSGINAKPEYGDDRSCRAKPRRVLTSSLPRPDIRSPSCASRATSPAPRKMRSWAPTRRCPRRPPSWFCWTSPRSITSTPAASRW